MRAVGGAVTGYSDDGVLSRDTNTERARVAAAAERARRKAAVAVPKMCATQARAVLGRKLAMMGGSVGAAFTRLDTDKSGAIDRGELLSALASLSIVISEHELTKANKLKTL